jgi:hypothetical protein
MATALSEAEMAAEKEKHRVWADKWLQKLSGQSLDQINAELLRRYKLTLEDKAFSAPGAADAAKKS